MLSEALSSGHKCSQNAVRSILTNMNFSDRGHVGWGGGRGRVALSPQFLWPPLSGISGSAPGSYQLTPRWEGNKKLVIKLTIPGTHNPTILGSLFDCDKV